MRRIALHVKKGNEYKYLVVLLSSDKQCIDSEPIERKMGEIWNQFTSYKVDIDTVDIGNVKIGNDRNITLDRLLLKSSCSTEECMSALDLAGNANQLFYSHFIIAITMCMLNIGAETCIIYFLLSLIHI